MAMMLVGSYGIAPLDVLASVLGLHPDPAVDFVVRELRLPTALAGLGVGLALGVAGMLFQTLLRNPLASPDIVGVSSGASLFAVGSIILFQVGSLGVSVAALVGALLSCGLVYVLAWRGGIVGYRFILIGIGIAEFMFSLVGYLIARADIYDAREAMTWLVGSLGQAGPGELAALLVAVAVMLPLAVLLDRPLRALELGDETATALGARVEWARFALIGVAIVLVAFATAAAGPIVFVALIAGPIAARLLGPATGGIIAAGLVGAALVLAADLVAEHVLPVPLPTGVVTGLIGAPYLIWLLATMNREGRGG
jgi:iron complex transport system permease protein